ncbi:class I SAM-dependent methyltransferase [Dokdonella sp.]|uniref:class I SAM-dependent methyltransferase n=1 Tax=Dokdonella sp. TaxID=2291710 RepID=UPI003C5FC1B6
MPLQAAHYFDLAPLRGLLSQEWSLVRQRASTIPSGAALSLRPSASGAETALRSHPEMIRLQIAEGIVSGDLRCRPDALPLDNDSVQLVVARHVLDLLDPQSGVAGELARILAPGGTLFLFGMNMLSPWRVWSAFTGGEVSSMPRFRSVLRVQREFSRAGLQPLRREFLGGIWPDATDESGFVTGSRLHGAWMLALSKQRSAGRVIPLRPRNSALSLGRGFAQMPSRRACL